MPDSRGFGLSALSVRRGHTALSRLASAIPLVVLTLAWAAFPRPSAAAPTAPGPTTVSCAYSITDNCWVTGDFVISVSPATGGTGSLVYQICRSVDSTGGFAGCDVNLTLNGGTSFTVSGTHAPADGYRRAYYFLARDSAGVLGPWNTPRYVRVDRYAPTVSATNASATWYSSRTATISANDATGGAGANSGLVAVRYRWNSALDAGCTAGTATSSGTALTAPAGDNILYLCARDNTGRVTQWNGQYRISAPLTAPGPTTVSCAYSITDNCWVTGDFVASVTPATGGVGSLVYQICRSVDSAGGFAGCDVNLTLNGMTSIAVSDTHLPADGYRRAYYFLARDSTGTLGPWNTPRYVRVDRYAPTVSATNASATWYSSRTATISADDGTGGAGANSGLAAVRYSWNTALNAGCTTGTATSSGSTLTAPAGDNILYLCARDNTGRVTQWNGQYRVSTPPTAPGPTTVSCAYSILDDCWVTGDFVASVTPATGGTGTLVYEICRSNNSPGGFAGCEASLTLNGSTSISITGVNLPTDGYRRAYYFLARDSLGVLGPWNTPRYVRVDRYAPTVSATNASATWYSSRTATVSAGDATVSAGANSGLAAVRYRWNTALDAGCTAGTATTAGTALTAPTGDNILYLCARDNTGRVTHWNGQYRVSTPPTAPGPTTVSCAYSILDDCWVTGDFVASVTPATGGTGTLVYEICRSNDSTGGFVGCEASLTLNGGTSISITGANLPTDGYRRAYYFVARDSAGVLGPWNTPRYVRVDRYAPTVSATNASDAWFSSRTATVSASDATGGTGANSGLSAVRYTWNTIPDMECAAGTSTSAGATLTAPAGDNTLYLCARDNTGRVTHWSGRYRVGALPTAPGPTAVSCAYSISDDCWVTGDFVASVTPATGGTGTLVYEICRSNDSTGGFVGCEANITLNGGTSISITGANLPSDGFRRAYYFVARDSAGALGPWNTPRYVRVDRYAPTVSATNASDIWYESRTATLSASDTTGGAGANSGLVAVRYTWNTVPDMECAAGTSTSSGATLTAPAGDNTLYLCARDNTGRVTHWSGRYRVGALPTAPGPTTVNCAYAVSDDCWVTGDFVASVTPATGGTGALTYRICRSNDSPGSFAGCEVNLTPSGGTSITVTGTHLPSDGYRRAYYFLARDSVGAFGPWNIPRYVRVDRYAPTVSATNASPDWFPSRTATLSASDTTGGAGANSGLVAVRYRWNTALDAGCTTGTVTSSGTTLTAPAGDNILYLCATDNTDRVGTWNGRYRVGTPSLTVTTTPSPSQSPYGTTITWRATASGGDPATRQYALFRRRPGGTWTPSRTSPAWQTGTMLGWTPNSSHVGIWEIMVWVKDGNTLPDENIYGYTDSFNPGQVEVVAPVSSDFTLTLTPSAASIVRGGEAQLTIGLTAGAGFSGTAALTVSGLPAGASHTLAPTAIGAGSTATLTMATTADTPEGDYTVTVTGAASGVTRTATANLTVLPPPASDAPVIESITPELFDGGTVKTITLTGRNFQGATVRVAQEDPDPNHPTNRVFPTIGETIINADGTRIDVRVDCTDPRIMDFYALVVDNGRGKAGSRPFRVIPAGPVVDLVTPNQPEIGEDHVYVLSLAGFHLRNATVHSEPAGALEIFGVDATNDTHINGLLRVPDGTSPGPVDLVVRNSQGREARITIEVVAGGTAQVVTQKISTRRIDPETGKLIEGPSPSVLFQRFAVRQVENTEVTSSGLHIQATASPETVSAASFSFVLYYRYTVNILSFTWSRAFVFDPVTGRIGDEILKGLGLGERVRFGAFVLAFHLSVDLTIEVYITTSGFTWPRFCISISAALQIPGYDGFFEQWDFCRGGGFVPFRTGSTSSLDARGGSCAQVTQEGPPQQGLIFGEAEQSECCDQPIEVTGEGVAFTGSSFATAFQITTPNAGTTTPGQQCACSIGVAPKCVLVGKEQKLTAQGTPASGAFQWSILQGSNRASITNGATSHEVTVRGDAASAAADDVALQVVYSVGGSTCAQTVNLSVVQLDTPPLEFRDSGQADLENARRNIPSLGLPTLGAVSPGSPTGTLGFHKNMQVKAHITPSDPNLRCSFDFKRTKQGVAGQIGTNGVPTFSSGHCPQGGCDDDATNSDEDLTVDGPPGGSIYALDTPGLRVNSTTGACAGFAGVIGISCFNFDEWLEVDGVRATDALKWHASTRVKCNGSVFLLDGAGAGNGIGGGATDCSLNTAFSPSSNLAASVVAGASSAESAMESVVRLADPAMEIRVAAYEALLGKAQRGELAGAERDEVVAALIERARGEAAEGEFQSAPLLAIQLLGELRAAEAVPVLLERLLDEFTRPVGGDADWTTPAAQALAKIGKAAIEPIIGKASSASEAEWSVLRSSLSLMKDQKSVKAEVRRQLVKSANQVAIKRLKTLLGE